MKKIKLVQVDGKLPNLALMKISNHYRNKNYQVDFSHNVERDMFETPYEKIYASSIFKFSNKKLQRLKQNYPNAIVGGTGTFDSITVEQVIRNVENKIDYSIYSDYKHSIGFSQRGCRLKCKFCVVPQKEGSIVEEKTIAQIYRGAPYPKNIMLLDNDFFGQPNWKARVDELKKGNFKVCFSQGINVRLINEEVADSLKSIKFYDGKFQKRRLYTAWDNLRDEKKFLSKIDLLLKNKIKPSEIMVYMLIGYDSKETWQKIFYRFNKMVEIGLLPYPMVYNKDRKDLKQFQRWVIRGYYHFIDFNDYAQSNKEKKKTSKEGSLF